MARLLRHGPEFCNLQPGLQLSGRGLVVQLGFLLPEDSDAFRDVQRLSNLPYGSIREDIQQR